MFVAARLESAPRVAMVADSQPQPALGLALRGAMRAPARDVRAALAVAFRR